jgi:hypothetical protein
MAVIQIGSNARDRDLEMVKRVFVLTGTFV